MMRVTLGDLEQLGDFVTGISLFLEMLSHHAYI